MKLLRKEALYNRVENITYGPKQQMENYVYLTVKAIYLVAEKGALDFGGSEYAHSKIVAIQPEMASKEDQYGWWDLKAGSYLVEFNETINPFPQNAARIVPSHHLLRNNAYHPEIYFTLEKDELEKYKQIPLVIGEPGLKIKQNARISCLYISNFKSEFYPPS